MRNERLQDLLNHLSVASAGICDPAILAKLVVIAEDQNSTPDQLKAVLDEAVFAGACDDFMVMALSTTHELWSQFKSLGVDGL